MKYYFSSIKDYLINLIFPKICVGCQREGTYLCEDCFSLVEVNPFCYCLCEKPQRIIDRGKCKKCQNKFLSGLFSATSWEQKILKKAIHRFKYAPYIKELSLPLAYLIILHFQMIEKSIPADSLLMPVPLSPRKKRERGFNQAEELAKVLAKAWKVPLVSDKLVKIKTTTPQEELKKEERIKNIKGVFSLKDGIDLRGKKIFLIDDVYTTGVTLEECARVLKQAGAKEVWGITIAREVKF